MAILFIDDITPSVEVRFWSYVDRRGPDDCWEWKAYRTKRGYGALKVSGIAAVATHVALFASGIARPDATHNALHSCDNPPCCNPAHLRWGTQSDNIGDAMNRGRWIVQRGSDNWKTKLTAERVRLIRAAEGGCVAVAKAFGISPSHVNNIRKRRVWDHI